MITHMMHAEELCHSEDDSRIPWQNGQSHKNDIEKYCWKDEDGNLSITLKVHCQKCV